MDGISTITGLVDFEGKGLTGLLATAELRLTATPFVPSRTTVPTDIPAPTFAGYAVKPVTFGPVGFDPATGKASAAGTATYQWVGPADNSGQTVVGWALAIPAAAGPPAILNTIFASGLLDAPVSLLDPTNQLTVAVQVQGDGSVSLTVLP